MQLTNPHNLSNFHGILANQIKVNFLSAVAANNRSIIGPLTALVEQLRPEERKHLQAHRMSDFVILDGFGELMECELIGRFEFAEFVIGGHLHLMHLQIIRKEEEEDASFDLPHLSMRFFFVVLEIQ